MITAIRQFFLGLLSAPLLVLAFPSFDFYWLAWIGLVPMLLAIKGKSLKYFFFQSYSTGLLFFMGIFYWINVIKGYTPLDFVLSGLYLGLYFAFFGLLLNLVSRQPYLPALITAPTIWVVMEYLRGQADFLAMPWCYLGHSQYLQIPVIQIAAFTGVYGISFLIVMVNVIISEMIYSFVHPHDPGRKNGKVFSPIMQSLLLVLICGAFTLGYGYWIIFSTNPDARRFPVTVIQGNIPQDIKWDPAFHKMIADKLIGLTRQSLAAGNTSLLVWPETSTPGGLFQNINLYNQLAEIAKGAQVSIVLGSSQNPKYGPPEFRSQHRFNSAILIDTRGVVNRPYNKIRLFPWGEYLPHPTWIPWPERIASKSGRYLPGKEFTIFPLGTSRFGAVICWESLFPDLFRQFPKQGAQFMVNITNEAWFGATTAPYQILSMNVFRAVENRTTVIRAANTGISCFISPLGIITDRITRQGKDIFVEGFLTKAISLASEKTFYTNHGDIFIFINFVALILYVILAVAYARKKWAK